MLFCSTEFVAFFAAVLVLYWALPSARLRVFLLVGASFYFYASWSAWLALVVVGSSTWDWALARRMDATRSEKERRILCTVSVLGNVGLLIYFKYANFFMRTIEDTLVAAGAQASLPVLHVLVPIGISFYTFEAINYTVSVYRREIPAERDLPSFMLFILFFPHLVAGPIVRAKDFLPQAHRPKRWRWSKVHAGVGLILLGLIKKVVIADRLAPTVDAVFAAPELHTRGAAWIGAFAYEVQCYGDFSGYSDMALGLAYLLGYKLAVNFDTPFLSTSPAEFWRRWHISLMSWIRDYVYRPLGGSRGAPAKVAMTTLLTMTIVGLWHGASLTFVLWGVVNGVLLLAHRAFVKVAPPMVTRALGSGPGTVLRIAATFTMISLASVSFRAESFSKLGAYLDRLVHAGGTQGAPSSVVTYVILFAMVAGGHVLHRIKALDWLDRAPAPLQGLVYGAAFTSVLVLAPNAGKTFIYFQF